MQWSGSVFSEYVLHELTALATSWTHIVIQRRQHPGSFRFIVEIEAYAPAQLAAQLHPPSPGSKFCPVTVSCDYRSMSKSLYFHAYSRTVNLPRLETVVIISIKLCLSLLSRIDQFVIS